MSRTGPLITHYSSLITRLGPHVLRPTTAAMDWAVRAPVVKALDDVAVLRAVPPAAIRVFRHYLPAQNLDDPTGTANAVLAALGGYRHPRLYVELWNEAHSTADQLRAATDILHAAGVRVAGGSFGTGDYVRADFDVVKAAGCDAIAIHCYWGNQGFTNWHALRYRDLHLPSDPPILITECGRDAVEGGGPGWQASGVTAEQYLAELLAYDAEIGKDAYVLGATPFTAGPTPDWEAYSTDPISARIPSGGPTVPTTQTFGLDVSNNNRLVSLKAVAACGFDFVFVKASEGTSFTDPYFADNWADAKANGLLRGAYHFARPSTNSGHAEAQYFLSVVTDLQAGDLLALDLEDTSVAATADLHAYAIDFLQTVATAVGFRPLFYSGMWYMVPHQLTGHADLAEYGLWLADYSATRFPVAPSPWPFWAIRQYSADGRVPSIGGPVDLDVFAGTRDQLARYGKLP